MTKIKTIVCDTFEELDNAERELINDGFCVYNITDHRIKLVRWHNMKEDRVDLYPRFWDANKQAI